MLPMHAPNMVPVCLRKGAWSEEEDLLLRKCIEKFGEGKWRQVPLRAGLNRCRKSCRLRWLNYLQPNIKRGEFSPDEIDLIIRMHKLLGNRWSLIAGRLPGRTANDIKNYCNSHLKKMISSSPSRLRNNKSIDYDYKKVVKTDYRHGNHHQPEQKKKKILKPQPRTFPKNSHWIFNNNNNNNNNTSTFIPRSSSNSSFNDQLSRNEETTTTPTSNTLWLKNILFQDNADQGQNNNEGGEKSFCDIDGEIIKDDLWSSDLFDDSLWRLLAGDENLN